MFGVFDREFRRTRSARQEFIDLGFDIQEQGAPLRIDRTIAGKLGM